MREVLPPALEGERVDRVVAMLTGLTRAEVADLVAAGAVRLGGRTVTSRSVRVHEGEELEVEVPPPDLDRHVAQPEPGVAVPVVHADDQVIVVDKPPDMVVHPGAGNRQGTMAQGLLARFPELAGVGEPERPGIVHRLDKGTSGLLVVARTPEAYASLVDQLSTRTVERRYLALVWGHPEPPRGMIDAPIGRSQRDPTRMAVSAAGREARTSYEVVTTYTEPVLSALTSCRLETGRTHQIRVHLAAIGHPVVGDPRYRGKRVALPCPRPFLHATELAFDHPGTGERARFESPLPDDLVGVLDGLSP
ncbi:MAG TPA: RluA family pseudouridine synthase [Acidimicrobiales bacterium]|nr:RluA family pseudouridine synthase [Acidimicrobiales bacterium]